MMNEGQRLSFFGRKTQLLIEEYNDALPKKLGKQWKERYIITCVQYGQAKQDAIQKNYAEGNPPWAATVNNIKDGVIIWHPSLNRNNEGSVLSFIFALQGELIASGMPEEKIADLLGVEMEVAINNCRNGSYYDAS